MMKKLFRGHLVYYFSLFGILLLGYILVSVSSPNKYLELLSIIITAILYATVGIMHHWLNHNLVSKIVLEYVLIGALGASLAFFVLKGGFGF